MTPTGSPCRACDNPSHTDHITVKGSLTVTEWSVDTRPEVHAFSDHGVVMASVPIGGASTPGRRHQSNRAAPGTIHTSTLRPPDWTGVDCEATDVRVADPQARQIIILTGSTVPSPL